MMALTSKFSFPMPGRKQRKKDIPLASRPPPAHSPKSTANATQSKAQRFFGTDGDLNIDSPTRNDDSPWGLSSSPSRAMSRSIPESTYSARADTPSDNGHEPQPDNWELDEGLFPKPPRLNGKASSTLLGQRPGDEGETSTSTANHRLRNADSSSTLRSYYDAHQSPLSISQQTSASSARDLALRKGLPPIMRHLHRSSSNKSREKGERKKPAKLDLSTLFPRARAQAQTSRAEPVSDPLSSGPKDQPNPVISRLKKEISRNSLRLRSSGYIQSNKLLERKASQSSGRQYQFHDHYEHVQTDDPKGIQVPNLPKELLRSFDNESAEAPVVKTGKSRDHQSKPPHGLGPGISQLQSPSHANRNYNPWTEPTSSAKSSAASISSRNTRTSKRSKNSVFSAPDLQQKSVLSLSSDSEEEDSDTEPYRPFNPSPEDEKRSFRLKGAPQQHNDSRRLSARPSSRNQGTRKSAAQASPFVSIPESPIPGIRLSRHWSDPLLDLPPVKIPQRRSSTQSVQGRNSLLEPKSSRREKRPSKTIGALASATTSQPTPPLSPTSVEFRADPQQSNRFMAVTKQEEALLEALRKKRATMRETSAGKDQAISSPPETTETTANLRVSEASGSTSHRSSVEGTKTQHVLLYMDTPLSETRKTDIAEPSPDLSDFLSFETDGETTPRASRIWPAPKPAARRPDSRGLDKSLPMTPPPTSRLSTYGAAQGLREKRSEKRSEKKKSSGVRFADERKSRSQDFQFDGDDTAIWGMQ